MTMYDEKSLMQSFGPGNKRNNIDSASFSDLAYSSLKSKSGLSRPRVLK